MSTQKPLLVVVEDSSNDILLLKRVLKKLDVDVEVEWLKDGASAIDFFEQNPSYKPRLVLLDIKLPKVTGLEVLQHLRQSKKREDLPVVVFSSSSQQKDIQAAYQYGTNAYLVKPAEYQGLKQVVASLYDFWFKYNKTFITHD